MTRLTELVRRRLSARWLTAVASALIVAVGVSLPVALTQGIFNQHRSLSGHQVNAVSVPGTFASAIANTLSLPIAINGVAVTANAVWAVGDRLGKGDRGVLVRVNPSTGAVVRKIVVGRQPLRIAVSATSIWVANNADDTVSRVSIARSAAVATIRTRGAPEAVAVSPGAVWIVSGSASNGWLTHVDPATGLVIATISVPPMAMDVVYANHAIWVASELDGGALTEIDPTTDKVVQSMPLLNVRNPYDIAAFGNTLAVIGANNMALDVVNASPVKVETSISVPFYTAAVSVDATGVYVASSGRIVAQFKMSASGHVNTKSFVSRTLASVADNATTGLGSVWFASNNKLIRIPTSR